MEKPMYSTKDLKHLEADYKISLLFSDGMWYSIDKIITVMKTTEEETLSWIKRNLKSGVLVQAKSGAQSYRFPLKSVHKWYEEHNIQIGTQLLKNNFPPRIWDNKTEVEGFLEAPLREIGITTFTATPEIANQIKERLRGIARIREEEVGVYKCYSLSHTYVKDIIADFFSELDSDKEYLHGTVRSRVTFRREIKDFSSEFLFGLISFYRDFANSLLTKEMETIKIYIPEEEDQKTQIMIWLLTAIEKFNESAAVPFSGYLNACLKRWPYNLPADELGKDLSAFQRKKKKVLTAYKNETDKTSISSAEEWARLMEMDLHNYLELEHKNNIWHQLKRADGLVWDETGAEKATSDFKWSHAAQDAKHNFDDTVSDEEYSILSMLSICALTAAVNTRDFESAYNFLTQLDKDNYDINELKDISANFVMVLYKEMAQHLANNPLSGE